MDSENLHVITVTVRTPAHRGGRCAGALLRAVNCRLRVSASLGRRHQSNGAPPSAGRLPSAWTHRAP